MSKHPLMEGLPPDAWTVRKSLKVGDEFRAGAAPNNHRASEPPQWRVIELFREGPDYNIVRVKQFGPAINGDPVGGGR